ncbi:MAG: nucleotidyl transferase AbiEii/AbiGii toxin family protein [Melioribacteraceae bacterium]|nr:nucleotidyl transferase AbiEii/AbiGii toxin family protein [Melioribacteraceae bacterium]
MNKDGIFFKQAELLLRILPIINIDKDLALKGGTALNFFVRDFPRLSIDIDLTYIPIKDRETSLKDVTAKLKDISADIIKTFPKARVVERNMNKAENLSGLQILNESVSIKIETNPVIRGSVYDPETFTLCSKAEEMFELSVKAQCLSIADLYGGKICAALDRQHPRDLFDVKLLLENEGFTKDIRKAFIVYLISHSRPIIELLAPNLKTDIKKIYEKEFIGMTEKKVGLKELTDTFELLVNTINDSITDDEKKFLLSFKSKNPNWILLGLEEIENMPSVKWKLMNLERMDEKRHQEAYKKLKTHLKY